MRPTEHPKPIDRPWATAVADLLRELGVDPERGLSEEEARKRRRRHGPNRQRESRRESAWRILLRQFRSIIILLLVVAAAVAFLFGEWPEGIAIAVVVLVNSALGFATELEAVRSMEALRRLGKATARVRRGGSVREVPAEDVVPGDLVVLEAGDVVAADLRLIEAPKLQADESTLTGESAPVAKRSEPAGDDAPLAERSSMVFKGTSLTRGSGEGVAVATGMNTELGRIAAMVEEAEEERTPLEERLDRLGARLVWVTLAITASIVASGIASGKALLLMIETGIALAVATVPEGLPIVATIALARGMLRMARRNALVNRLSAVETLGATNLICSDKTGTLTENRMTLVSLRLADGDVEIDGGDGGGATRGGKPVDLAEDELLRTALEIGALCNNADLGDGGADGAATGDPMEVALLRGAARAGMRRSALREKEPEVREEPFDPDTKMMATVHSRDGSFRVAVKGAPEAVLRASSRVLERDGERDLDDGERRAWLEKNSQLAGDGLRVLALATKTVRDEKEPPYRNLVFAGLAGLLDPPRRDVKKALAACREAGIRVVMVTGDQPRTARKIGEELGLNEGGEAAVVAGRDLAAAASSDGGDRHLLEAEIFARVSPKQKLDLIRLYQRHGHVVAMTGDGVNDAPALKKADIGIAMGRRGTQVACEAADMILRDDAFSTIVAAVEQGRIIFGNIRRFVFYLLSCNVSEVMAVGIASFVDVPLPIRPLQILFLNLVTDVFPALALGMGEGGPNVMRAAPRDPGESILTRRHWLAIGAYGALLTASVFGAFALAFVTFDLDEKRAVTISFLTLAFAQLWHVFNMRDRGSPVLGNDVARNPYVWGALGLCTVLLLAAIYVPVLSDVLRVADPGALGWSIVAGASLAPLAVGQLLLARRRATTG